MRDVFAIHNELGRIFEEDIYKRALAVRRHDVRLEEPIDVTIRTFTKQYSMDVLVAGGGLFEFKAVDYFVPRHRAVVALPVAHRSEARHAGECPSRNRRAGIR